MKNAMIFTALVAFVAAVPDTTSSDLPETMLVDEAASYEEAAAFLQKSNSNACLDLATATEKEVKDNVKQQQDMLNKLPNGSQCNSRGQDLIKKAEANKRDADRKVSDANKKVAAANNANVVWGKAPFNSIQKGKCEQFYNGNAYRTAASRFATATATKQKAQGAAQEAKNGVALAKEQAASLVKQCQCNTATAHAKMLGDAKKKSESQNKAAWTKAAHLRCVIKGISASKCRVPTMPTVTAPRLVGASLSACNNHVAMVINGNDNTMHYGSALWTNKQMGTFGKGNMKKPAFLLPATKATMKFWNGRAVSFNMHGRSLYDNFRGGTRNINIDGGYGRWRGLGFSWQPNCNHQGFNLREPHNNNVRLGINFNNENNCGSTDASIGVGMSRFTGGRSAGGFCGCCSAGNGCHQRAGTVTISVNVKAGTMITPKPTKSPTKSPTRGGSCNPSRGGYKFTSLTVTKCPSGMCPIFSESTCKTAMKSLTGKSVSSVGRSCWHKHPQGCFTHYPKNKSTRILMNKTGCGLKTGTTYFDTSAICKRL